MISINLIGIAFGMALVIIWAIFVPLFLDYIEKNSISREGDKIEVNLKKKYV